MACTVSAPGWNSGGMTSSLLPAGVHVFQPFRIVEPMRFVHGDHYGRQFASWAELSAFAVSRGYSMVYRGPYAVGRKVHRAKLADWHRFFMAMVREMDTWAGVRELVGWGDEFVSELFGDGGAGCHWACGFWSAARRLRPDLFVERLTLPVADVPEGDRWQLVTGNIESNVWERAF